MFPIHVGSVLFPCNKVGVVLGNGVPRKHPSTIGGYKIANKCSSGLVGHEFQINASDLDIVGVT